MNHEQTAMARAEFISMLEGEFFASGVPDHVAEQYAQDAMRMFEDSGVFGDPDFIWGWEGAEIMAQDYLDEWAGEIG